MQFFCEGKGTKQLERWDEHEGMQASQMHVEKTVAHAKEEMGIQKQDETKCHYAPFV
jgi:hypothetical protein